jgi:hypothetical protein
MKLKIIFVVVIIFLYMLYSTKVMKNKTLCKYKHISQSNILSIDLPGTYKIYNPSICKYESGYVLCCRYSNMIDNNLYMYLYNNLKVVINGNRLNSGYDSKICFIILDNKFKIRLTIFPEISGKQLLEDPRIIYYRDLFFVSVTIITKNNVYPCMYIFNKDFSLLRKVDYDWKQYKNVKAYIYSFPEINKNWCPFSYRNRLFIHTDSYPEWNVFEISLNKDMSIMNMKNILVNYDTSVFFKDLNQSIVRCSTSWIDFTENTFLCGLHTKECRIKKLLPTIRSIFVEIDKNTFKPIRKTKVLCFDFKNDSRIQFLSGMEVDDYNIYITFGVGDYKFEVKKISKRYVKSLLY